FSASSGNGTKDGNDFPLVFGITCVSTIINTTSFVLPTFCPHRLYYFRLPINSSNFWEASRFNSLVMCRYTILVVVSFLCPSLSWIVSNDTPAAASNDVCVWRNEWGVNDVLSFASIKRRFILEPMSFCING